MSDKLRAPVPVRGLGIAAIWGGIGFFDALQTVFTMRSQGMHHAWTQLFIVELLRWLPWALVTPLVIRLGRRYPPVRGDGLSTYFAHAGAVLGIDLVTAAWMTLLQSLLNPFAQPDPRSPFSNVLLSELISGLLPSFILYAVILTIVLMLDAQEALTREEAQAAQLNEQLSRAQLHTLQQQLEPHFMFNTLNAVAGLVRERRNDEAVSMIAGLSEFLRQTIESSGRAQVPLASELEYLQRYLAIQQTRFSDRLHVEMNIPATLLRALVPSLVLQPLVENAIKHGIARREEGGTIRIAGSRGNGMLNLSVHNDGPILPPGWDKSRNGIGLANLRHRMQLLYGHAFELTLQNEGTNGVRALVSVPFKVV
jgi:two-component system, LytTR family, sensor kinase